MPVTDLVYFTLDREPMNSTPVPGIRLRAVGVVTDGCRVLLHRRLVDPFWALPGGRVEPGEFSAEALARELHEELGVQATVSRLLWVVENHFTHNGAHLHEVGLYFEATLGTPGALRSGVGAIPTKEPHLEFAWFEHSQLARLSVRPTIIAERLALPPYRFEYIVHHDRAV